MKATVKINCPQCGYNLSDLFLAEFKQRLETDLRNQVKKNQLELEKKKNEYEVLSEELKRSKQELLEKEKNLKHQLGQEVELKIRERDLLIETLKVELDKVRQKAQNTSQQFSGEVLEKSVEQILRDAHPNDEIIEIKKGQAGCDCILKIKSKAGEVIGSIAFEVKNTSTFSKNWTAKLKRDNLSLKADLLVIVSKTMPPGVTSRFTIIDDVWCCNSHPESVRDISLILKFAIWKIQETAMTHKGKEDKMSLLWEYITSPDFQRTFTSILDSFKELRESHQAEKVKLQALWAQREAALESILSRTVEFYCSIKVSGEIPEIKSLNPDFRQAS